MKLTRAELYKVVDNYIKDPPEQYFLWSFHGGENTVIDRDSIISFIIDNKQFNKSVDLEVKNFSTRGYMDISVIIADFIVNNLKNYPDYKNIMKLIKNASQKNSQVVKDEVREFAAISYIPTLKKLGYRVDKPATKK